MLDDPTGQGTKAMRATEDLFEELAPGASTRRNLRMPPTPDQAAINHDRLAGDHATAYAKKNDNLGNILCNTLAL